MTNTQIGSDDVHEAVYGIYHYLIRDEPNYSSRVYKSLYSTKANGNYT